MSTARIMTALGIAGASAWYGATKVKIGSDVTDRGTIEHVITDVDKYGKFINNNKMYFSHEAEPGTTSMTDLVAESKWFNPRSMDFPENSPLLIKKAQQFSGQTSINVTYDQFLAANPFTGKSSRVIKNIEAADKPEQMKKIRIL